MIVLMLLLKLYDCILKSLCMMDVDKKLELCVADSKICIAIIRVGSRRARIF